MTPFLKRDSGRQPWLSSFFFAIFSRLEGSHSGLVHTLGKRAWGNPPRVRISHPPPEEKVSEICGRIALRCVAEGLKAPLFMKMKKVLELSRF